MTWWQAVLQYVLPIMLGLFPTIYLLNTARKKAVKDVDGADASASKTYMEAAKGMAEQNRELLQRVDIQDHKISKLENSLLKQGAEIAELERGIRALCHQLEKEGLTPCWTLNKRTFSRVAK